ncbi:hypothetical protein VCHA53O466_40314 [Vibrio chagasii]|nr:hypothetical protein VCHA53O466_40314 [Vibrio chagasii]
MSDDNSLCANRVLPVPISPVTNNNGFDLKTLKRKLDLLANDLTLKQWIDPSSELQVCINLDQEEELVLEVAIKSNDFDKGTELFLLSFLASFFNWAIESPLGVYLFIYSQLRISYQPATTTLSYMFRVIKKLNTLLLTELRLGRLTSTSNACSQFTKF